MTFVSPSLTIKQSMVHYCTEQRFLHEYKKTRETMDTYCTIVYKIQYSELGLDSNSGRSMLHAVWPCCFIGEHWPPRATFHSSSAIVRT